MRKDITALCLTAWGAVLEVKAIFKYHAWVADPDSIDSGQDISINDIVLV